MQNFFLFFLFLFIFFFTAKFRNFSLFLRQSLNGSRRRKNQSIEVGTDAADTKKTAILEAVGVKILHQIIMMLLLSFLRCDLVPLLLLLPSPRQKSLCSKHDFLFSFFFFFEYFDREPIFFYMCIFFPFLVLRLCF